LGQLASGQKGWSILTDVSDENLANLHGVNYSAKCGGNPDKSIVSVGGSASSACRVTIRPLSGSARPKFRPKLHVRPGAASERD